MKIKIINSRKYLGDFMNFKEAEDYIYSLGMFSLFPSLIRMQNAVKTIECQNNFPIIHIAGTNGKGSVSAMTSAAIKKAGYKTGLFISPHIINFRERIQINGEYISEEDAVRLTEYIMGFNLKLTEFEFITVMALLYFNEQKIDVGVIETGLGGRLDATNIMDKKLVSVITKIGLDHTKILGDTIEKIAGEKCGIIKNCKTVTSPYQEENALKVIKENSSELYIPELSKLEVIRSDAFGNEFIYKGEKYLTSMSGTYQIENAVTAIETLKNCGLNVNPEDIVYGIKKGFMPARMQMVSMNPLIIVDGAHNPDGAKALASFLESQAPVTAIVGVMKDKNYEDVLKTTLKYANRVICVKPCDYGRSLSAEELLETAKKYCPAASKENSLKAALKSAKQSEDPIFVFGSLYLASEFLKLF